MYKIFTTEDFIEISKKKHGDKFDYSETKYKDSRTKLTIICPIHGQQTQTPRYHYTSGHGCVPCSFIKKPRITTDEFIEKSKNVHGDKYDYSKANFINTGKLITIICKKHDVEFYQTSINHLNGYEGCPKCSSERKKNLYTKSTEQFISESKVLHGKNFSYEKTEYVRHNKKLIITCTKCGRDIMVSPSNFLQNFKGCTLCGEKTSIPERFLSNILTELNIEYKKEYIPDWSCDKRYDFYIPSLSLIIETHGAQHYGKGFETMGRGSLEETINNDKFKKELALNNGIANYVEIDCSESRFNFLFPNIKNSLKDFINLNDIDAKSLLFKSETSKFIKIIELYNLNIYSKKEIAEIVSVTKNTVNRYIAKGELLGKCAKKTEFSNNKLVYKCDLNFKLIKIFNTMAEASLQSHFSESSFRKKLKDDKGYFELDNCIWTIHEDLIKQGDDLFVNE